MHLCCFVMSKKSRKLRTFVQAKLLARKSIRVIFLLISCPQCRHETTRFSGQHLYLVKVRKLELLLPQTLHTSISLYQYNKFGPINELEVQFSKRSWLWGAAKGFICVFV